jgi:hypothetical protein
LQDEQEARRATLAIAAGRPTLTLHDENGKLRVLLVVTPHGPALGLLDENGKDRASVAVVASGGRKASILTLQDENGKGKVTLTAPDTSIDKPTLAVEDESGKSSSLIRASGLALMGEDAKTRAMLSIIDDVPALFLNDKLQRTRVSLGAVPIKTGTRWSLNIADVDGRTLLAVP